MTISRLLQRAYHLWQRIIRETKDFFPRRKTYGTKVAKAAFVDGLIPPGKSPEYITVISEYVDSVLSDLNNRYACEAADESSPEEIEMNKKIPVWCCWWQGVESMPELVRLCHERLLQVLPAEKAELHIITNDNYKKYVDIPQHIIDKYEKHIITMATMSDALRFRLLERYGGYWLDATVFFTGDIPEPYFSGHFYCQKMVENTAYSYREACGSRWCGFSMAGPENSILFRYMNDAFSLWWERYDSIIDYVLIDYLLLSGYRHVPAIKKIIDSVSDNNEDIFEMYQVLNRPYSADMYEKLIKRNVMHKLTYKMDLAKETADGELTLYGFLCKEVFENQGRGLY